MSSWQLYFLVVMLAAVVVASATEDCELLYLTSPDNLQWGVTVTTAAACHIKKAQNENGKI